MGQSICCAVPTAEEELEEVVVPEKKKTKKEIFMEDVMPTLTAGEKFRKIFTQPIQRALTKFQDNRRRVYVNAELSKLVCERRNQDGHSVTDEEILLCHIEGIETNHKTGNTKAMKDSPELCFAVHGKDGHYLDFICETTEIRDWWVNALQECLKYLDILSEEEVQRREVEDAAVRTRLTRGDSFWNISYKGSFFKAPEPGEGEGDVEEGGGDMGPIEDDPEVTAIDEPEGKM